MKGRMSQFRSKCRCRISSFRLRTDARSSRGFSGILISRPIENDVSNLGTQSRSFSGILKRFITSFLMSRPIENKVTNLGTQSRSSRAL